LVLDAVRPRIPSCVDAIESNGDAVALVSAWEDTDLLVVVDAVVSGGKPGTIYRFDGAHRLPALFFRAASSHVLGLAEALELARALGRLPERVMVVGIEAGDVAFGDGLTPAAMAAVPRATDLVLQILEELHTEVGDERGVGHA
jgi:hydrogenase maturation protease